MTIGAMRCQKDIAEKIVVQDADYLLAVKVNQKRLEQAIGQVFNSGMLNSFEGDKYVTQSKEHGHTETCLSMVDHNTDFLGYMPLDWAGLPTIDMVVSIRQEASRNNANQALYKFSKTDG
nr:hypothetical protein BCU61_06185 [Vibrio splendidus]